AKIPGGEGRVEPDREPAGLAAARALRSRRQRFHLLQNRTCAAEELTARLGCSNASARPYEHGHANRFFELTDTTAERRLPKEQGFRGATKATVIRSCESVT